MWTLNCSSSNFRKHSFSKSSGQTESNANKAAQVLNTSSPRLAEAIEDHINARAFIYLYFTGLKVALKLVAPSGACRVTKLLALNLHTWTRIFNGKNGAGDVAILMRITSCRDPSEFLSI